MNNDIEVRVVPDPDAATILAAETIADAARQAVLARGRFVIALSGGKSPQPVFRHLATVLRDAVPWDAAHVWFGDERCVLPDDAMSNYGMAKASLLDHVPVPPEHVHPLFGGQIPGLAARQADEALREFAKSLDDDVLFDIVMLGAGPDGHTASLFPEHHALEEAQRLIVHTEAPAPFEVRDRLTMTLPALSSARLVLMLATGADKREVLHAAHERGELPVGMVRGRERTLWLVDQAAWG